MDTREPVPGRTNLAATVVWMVIALGLMSFLGELDRSAHPLGWVLLLIAGFIAACIALANVSMLAMTRKLAKYQRSNPPE